MDDKHVVDTILETFETLTKAFGSLPNLKYELGRLKEHQAALFKYAKFKVGDRVKLRKTLTFDKNHGWKHHEHFMKKGAKATVRGGVDHYYGVFHYMIEFDKETWIDTVNQKKPVERPVTSKHVFCFKEDDLRKA